MRKTNYSHSLTYPVLTWFTWWHWQTGTHHFYLHGKSDFLT